jgi:hypothetical protein
MEIAQILKRLEDSEHASNAGIKTASAPPSSVSPTANALRNELRQALSTVQTEKTAQAAPKQASQAPVAGLVKMASDLVNAEEEALMKQAQVYGAAICDGFMARYAQYEQAANEVVPQQAKTAAATDVDFQKFAQENPELTKEAYDLGYRTKMAELQKQADERFQAGYNDTMNEVHKTAAALYKHGTEWAQWAVKTAEAAQAR